MAWGWLAIVGVPVLVGVLLLHLFEALTNKEK